MNFLTKNRFFHIAFFAIVSAIAFPIESSKASEYSFDEVQKMYDESNLSRLETIVIGFKCAPKNSTQDFEENCIKTEMLIALRKNISINTIGDLIHLPLMKIKDLISLVENSPIRDAATITLVIGGTYVTYKIGKKVYRWIKNKRLKSFKMTGQQDDNLYVGKEENKEINTSELIHSLEKISDQQEKHNSSTLESSEQDNSITAHEERETHSSRTAR